MKFKRENMRDNDQKLIWDMCETLESISSKLDEIININTKVEIKDVKVEAEKPKDEIKHTCKICNTSYDNKGSLMGCYRKHKKEGSNDVRTKPSATSKGNN